MTPSEVIENYFCLLTEEIDRARSGDGMTEVRAKFINEGINMVLDSMHAQRHYGYQITGNKKRNTRTERQVVIGTDTALLDFWARQQDLARECGVTVQEAD